MSDTELNEMLEGHAKEKAALLLRVTELEGKEFDLTSQLGAATIETVEALEAADALRAQVESLTAQLVAATNDAARAELRARDLVDAFERARKRIIDGDSPWMARADAWIHLGVGIAANPDSDERLREVIGAAARKMNAHWWSGEAPADEIKAIVDEVLRGAP